MSEANPFSLRLFARWPDMDFNQHMRNAAYLGAAEDCRMSFLADRGFTIDTFRAQGFGPVVVEDKLTYKKELRLLEPFEVRIELAASTRDARKMRVRNTIVRDSDKTVCAVVESVILWLDLAARKPRVPPEELQREWLTMARTAEFTWLEG
ncbi:MAG: acyl-CoA thioesterase [Myxococcota bacterium]